MIELSPHFTLEELTHSDVAVRKGLDNTPPPPIVARLINTAQRMEGVRVALRGLAIKVLSGYRSPAVNKAVGGSAVSAHCDGDAVDFICPSFGDPKACALALIAAGIEYDQLIYEGTWVHTSFAEKKRGQVLTAHFNGGPATYTQGIA